MFEKEDHKLATALIYRASIREEQQLPSFAFVRRNFAPPRVRFFAWLLLQNRIQCKVNLEKKGILTDATCDLCKKNDEDANHIVLRYDFARQFWARIGWQMEQVNSVENLWSTKPPPRTHPKATSPLILLCCWEL